MNNVLINYRWINGCWALSGYIALFDSIEWLKKKLWQNLEFCYVFFFQYILPEMLLLQYFDSWSTCPYFNIHLKGINIIQIRYASSIYYLIFKKKSIIKNHMCNPVSRFAKDCPYNEEFSWKLCFDELCEMCSNE